MDHQDWKTVVFRSKIPNPKPKLGSKSLSDPVIKYHAPKNTQEPRTINARQIEEKADEGDLTIPKITFKLQMQIQSARQAKQWTQKQLAQACQMPYTVVKDYENGTIIPKSQDLVKMSKVLGVTLCN